MEAALRAGLMGMKHSRGIELVQKRGVVSITPQDDSSSVEHTFRIEVWRSSGRRGRAAGGHQPGNGFLREQRGLPCRASSPPWQGARSSQRATSDELREGRGPSAPSRYRPHERWVRPSQASSRHQTTVSGCTNSSNGICSQDRAASVVMSVGLTGGRSADGSAGR